MLTRKHLEALAQACADVERTTGADAHDVSAIIVGALWASGGITPNYDPARFSAAVEDARSVPFMVVAR